MKTKQLLLDFIDIYGNKLLYNNGDNPLIDNLVERIEGQFNEDADKREEVCPIDATAHNSDIYFFHHCTVCGSSKERTNVPEAD
jgi:hypothetical protein